jgi:hypothetical protein
MGDVADMLGLAQPRVAPLSAAEEALRFLTEQKNKASIQRPPGKKPKGMKREVFDLLGKNGIVPAMQGSTVTVPSFKTKRVVAGRGKWVYDPIESSARHDNQKTFLHWVKADINYADYPYAKFNVKLDPVRFTEEEYNSHIRDEHWTREDTQTVLDICHKYELRWPIIFDRITLSAVKSSEEIEHRYFTIQNKLHACRDIAATATVDKKLYEFDFEKESKRRLQQDVNFKRYRSFSVVDKLNMLDLTTHKCVTERERMSKKN